MNDRAAVPGCLWWSAIPATLALIVLAGANAFHRWALWRMPTMGTSFGDLRQITATSECLLDRPGWSFDEADL